MDECAFVAIFPEYVSERSVKDDYLPVFAAPGYATGATLGWNVPLRYLGWDALVNTAGYLYCNTVNALGLQNASFARVNLWRNIRYVFRIHFASNEV